MAKPLEELKKIRLKKLEKIRKLGIDPYPARCEREQTIAKALKMMNKKVAVAGRIMSMRGHGGIQFFDLQDESGKIQLVFKKEKLSTINHKLISLLDIGDFIDAQGKVFKTKAGEISVLVSDFHLLTKSLRPLPSKWQGLKDIELRHRKRYLDLLLNEQVKDVFIRRSQILNAIRRFLNEKGFVEIETPILQPVAGGAIARPFKTYLEALDKNFFLRIAPELHLKRLLVGGYEKVYEMGPTFRNEGFSPRHNPEYTLLEIYQAYADYNDIMDLSQELVVDVAKQVLGKMEFKFEGKKISLKGKWPRIKMRTLIKEKTGVDIDKTSRKDLMKILKREKIEIEPGADRGKLIDKFFGVKVEPELIQPTFVIDLPRDVSPLAKAHPKEKGYVERFEFYIGGYELANAYSEINDPLEQKERFLEQIEKKKKGEEETHPMDKDFIEALEYGMPPAGGIGFGVDRLVILFTDMPNIREVILFPIMKPERFKK